MDDVRRTMADHKSSPSAFGSGELKIGRVSMNFLFFLFFFTSFL